MKMRIVLATVALSALSALAHSAETVHLYIVDSKKPKSIAFKGEVERAGMSAVIRAAREAGSGLATGKRQHGPIRVRVPKGNPAFQGLVNNVDIYDWQLQFVRKSPQGKMVCYETITMTKVRAKHLPPKNRASPDQEWEMFQVTIDGIKAIRKQQVWVDDWLTPV